MNCHISSTLIRFHVWFCCLLVSIKLIEPQNICHKKLYTKIYVCRYLVFCDTYIIHVYPAKNIHYIELLFWSRKSTFIIEDLQFKKIISALYAHSAGSTFNSLQNEHERLTEYKFIKYDLPTNDIDENLNNFISPFSTI